jgi:hypothetical protein
MKIYIHNHYKYIIMAPAKTGSSTIQRMLQTRIDWDNIFLGKKITDPQNLLLDYLDSYYLQSHKVIVMVRNPFDWFISGFRWMQFQNATHSTLYPDTLKDHLIAVKNNSVECGYWQEHCLYQPADFYRREYGYWKLENFPSFVKFLKRQCGGDFNEYSNYNINQNIHVPFPEVGDFEANLILELSRRAAILTNYNVEESIKNYREKYNKGELNELPKSHVQQ